MSSYGTKAIKVCLLIVLLLLVVLSLVCINSYTHELDKQNHVTQNYYAKLQSLLESSDDKALKDAFVFDFDRAYVAKTGDETYADEEYFLKKLDVTTNVDIRMLESESLGRVLFIKNNCIIYDFVYELDRINILTTGVQVYPNSTLQLTKQDIDNAVGYIINIVLDE